MKAITKTVVLLLIVVSLADTACGPKVPKRTTVTPSDSTGGTPPDTLQQSARLKKKPIRKLPPAPIRNDSTGGTPPDTLKAILSKDSL